MMRVVIADKDRLVIQLLARLVDGEHDMSVTRTYTDGASLLKGVQSGQHDVIILDPQGLGSARPTRPARRSAHAANSPVTPSGVSTRYAATFSPASAATATSAGQPLPSTFVRRALRCCPNVTGPGAWRPAGTPNRGVSAPRVSHHNEPR